MRLTCPNEQLNRDNGKIYTNKYLSQKKEVSLMRP